MTIRDSALDTILARPKMLGRKTLLGFRLALLLIPGALMAAGGDGRILATNAITTLEGSAGGAFNPFAIIAGYGAQGQQDFDFALSLAHTDDLDLRALAFAYGYSDRFEFTLARLEAKLPKQGPGNGPTLGLDTIGAKLKLFGDLIYGSAPQISAGVQYKLARDDGLVRALGASDRSGVDAYLAVSRLWLDGPWHRNLLLNATLRSTQARQLGLLGFAEDRDWELGLSSALLLNPNWAVGGELRLKRRLDAMFDEQRWWNGFIAWFPNKKYTVTLGYADLGVVGPFPEQQGIYLSLKWNP